MNKNLLFVWLIACLGCSSEPQQTTNLVDEKKAINTVLDNWHKAATEANAKDYFSAMDSISVFIGTDATENWNRKAFEAFSKPYFEKGKAWSFTAAQRNVYLNGRGDVAWFDELLQTWMGACRGSGVLEKKGKDWKIKHYVLSVTVPNDDIQQLIDIKFKKDSLYLKSLPKR